MSTAITAERSATAANVNENCIQPALYDVIIPFTSGDQGTLLFLEGLRKKLENIDDIDIKRNTIRSHVFYMRNQRCNFIKLLADGRYWSVDDKEVCKICEEHNNILEDSESSLDNVLVNEGYLGEVNNDDELEEHFQRIINGSVSPTPMYDVRNSSFPVHEADGRNMVRVGDFNNDDPVPVLAKTRNNVCTVDVGAFPVHEGSLIRDNNNYPVDIHPVPVFATTRNNFVTVHGGAVPVHEGSIIGGNNNDHQLVDLIGGEVIDPFLVYPTPMYDVRNISFPVHEADGRNMYGDFNNEDQLHIHPVPNFVTVHGGAIPVHEGSFIGPNNNGQVHINAVPVSATTPNDFSTVHGGAVPGNEGYLIEGNNNDEIHIRPVPATTPNDVRVISSPVPPDGVRVIFPAPYVGYGPNRNVDVAFGQGKSLFAGTAVFQFLLALNEDNFSSADMIGKRYIIETIVKTLQRDGRRFFGKTINSNTWHLLEENQVLSKSRRSMTDRIGNSNRNRHRNNGN
jgi:hypothetical protein